MTRYQPFHQPFLPERVRQRCTESARSQTEMVWGQEQWIIIGLQHRRKAGTEAPAKLGRSMHRNSSRSCEMVVTLGIREFASNDRHVFLEVVVRSWTNSHRNEVELVNRFCMVGPRQAVYMVTPRVLGKLHCIIYGGSYIVPFRNFLFSGLQKWRAQLSVSPVPQSSPESSPESSPPNTDGLPFWC